MVLTVVESLVLEVFHKIFSGSSTIVGGFGSGPLSANAFYLSKEQRHIVVNQVVWKEKLLC